jgi:hypothetical protein
MTTYYVNKEHGNDTTGNGLTHDTAWLTISCAILSIPESADHTVLIGDGVYSESTYGLGYLLLQRIQAVGKYITLQPENGAVGVVEVRGDTSTTYQVRFDHCKRVIFKWVIFSSATNQSDLAGRVKFTDPCDGMQFINCQFITRSVAGRLIYGLMADTGAAAVDNILVQGCTFTQTGISEVRHVRFTGVHSNITIKDCSIINGNSINLWFTGVTNLLIDNVVCINTTAFDNCLVGNNADSGTGCSGIIRNSTFISALSHSLTIGAICSGITVTNCIITGGDNALVVKHCDTITITNNTLISGSANGLYLKGATNVTASGNIIKGSTGSLVKVGNSSDLTKCGNINFQNNIIKGTGTSRLFDWGDTVDDSGGSVCDHNHYSPRGTNKFGTVWGSADGLATLAALIAAWATYGDGSNDSHSLMWSPGKNFLIPSLALRR